MLDYYDSWNGITPSAKNQWFSEANAFLNSQWYDSAMVCTVQEEDELGSFTFHDIEVWKNPVTTFTTNIIKNEYDFRQLMFRDNNHTIHRGHFYKIEDEIYMVYEGTHKDNPYSEVLVRRCNNLLKWIDMETGELFTTPCIIDYNISQTNPRVNNDIIVQNSSYTLILQGNEKTLKLKPNQRFIFNHQCYKFIAYNNVLQNNYIDENATMLFLDIDLDITKPTDDIENNIADRYAYNFDIVVENSVTQQVVGGQGQLFGFVTYNGETTQNQITWKGNRYIRIESDGSYVLTGDVGKKAIVTASFGNTEKIIEIEIVDFAPIEKQVVIEPAFDKIFESQSIEFDVWVWYGNEQTDDEINVSELSNISDHYTLYSTDNHHFVLTNLKCSIAPLQLQFTSGEVERTLTVQLKAMF